MTTPVSQVEIIDTQDQVVSLEVVEDQQGEIILLESGITELIALEAPGAQVTAVSDDLPLPLGVPTPGSSFGASRADHVHAHGNQTGGSLHALATTGAAGFMPSADKAKLDAATNINTPSTLVLRDSSGNFAADTITAALAGNASSATVLQTGRTIGMTGDVVWTSSSFNGSANVTGLATLANSGVTAGTYTKITVDAKGRVTVGAFLAASDIPTLTASKISDFDTQVRTNRLDQMAAPTASVSFNNQRITGLAIPVADTDAASKAYVDAIKQGLDIKDSVRAATTGNITLSGIQTIDDVALIAGDRVLVKNQSTASLNGIYIVASGAWTRSADADSSADVTSGLFTFVSEGTVNSDSGWVLATNDPITLGTTSLTFVQFSGAGQINAGDGMTKSGNTLNVVGTAGRIVANADSLDLASGIISATGTYRSVTVDTYGRVTAGTNPTTLSGYGITDAQPLDADLTAIAGLSGTTGLLRKTAANTWSLDTNTYLTGNQAITFTGDATGSGTTSVSLTLANSGVTAGTYNNSATTVTPFTVDAKGRITGTGTPVTIAPAFSSIASKPTTLSGYGITDALSNSTTSTQNGYFGDIYLYDDSTPSHYLQVTNSANLTAARSLSINVNDANRVVSLSGNLTVSSAATVSGTNTGDQTITLTGAVTGSGTGSISATLASGVVSDGNVATNAAIAGTKISPDFGSQTIQTTGVFSHALGTASAPTITFTGDPDTGMYSPGANQLALSTAGVERLLIDSVGLTRISADTGTSNPFAGFGVLRLLNTNASGNYTSLPFYLRDTTSVERHGASIALERAGAWTGGSGAYAGHLLFSTRPSSGDQLERMRITSTGNVGIGTTAPSTRLHVADTGVAAVLTIQQADEPATNTLRPALNLTKGSTDSFTLSSEGGTSTGVTYYEAKTATGQHVFITDNTEKLRIRADGNIGLGGVGAAQVAFYNQKQITGNATAYANWSVNSIQSDVTTAAYVYRTQLSTAAASFTVDSAYHYVARQIALGAGSAITSQFGFAAESNITGATNNYGFYSNIPAAAGRWNFYANGSADNYFAGQTFTGARLIVGSSSILNDGAGSVGMFQIQAGGANNGRVSTQAHFGSVPVWRQAASASTTVGVHAIVANGSGLGQHDWVGSDGTNFIKAAEITCSVDGTPSTGVMPGRLVFSTTPAGSGTSVERMRIRADGNVSIGGAGFNNVTFTNQKDISGQLSSFANYTGATVQSDVTTAAFGYRSVLTTAAASFTLTALQHYTATQTPLGAGSTVTNQYGFHAESNLTGAVNNFGFLSNIPSATGRWNFYANNTAPNYFAGDVRTNTTVTCRTSPVNSNVTATATAASLLDGIRTGTPTADIDLQLPTGTNMDAAFQDLQANQSFEWSVINLATAASGFDITVTANTSHTVVGSMVVTGETSGRFLTRKTAANTFVTYRIA